MTIKFALPEVAARYSVPAYGACSEWALTEGYQTGSQVSPWGVEELKSSGSVV